MKSSYFLLVFTASFFVFSFVKPNPKTIKPGVYELNISGENILKALQINEDFTFLYFDKTNSKNLVEIKGTWFISGDKLILKSTGVKLPIKEIWKIDTNEKCLKSRKGLAFYRICNC